MPRQAHTRGLTLPELALIMLVIVASAVALAPLLAKAREHQRRGNCAGNLQQIGLAELMYDNNSGPCYFPLTPSGVNHEPLNTAALLADGQVYACPSASVARTLCHSSNYRYRGSGLNRDNAHPALVSVAYDQSGNHPDNRWMNALFIDGHVDGAPPDGSKGWNRND